MRKTFIKTLVSLARKDERVFLVTPDIGYSVLEEFMHEFPDRFLNVGVAEQNSVSVAAGLALTGFIPYVYTINPFVSMRPFEQIRVDVAYMNTKVRLVGVGAGFSYGAAGATHHSIEDIAIMRALPNMTVICPGDPWETEQATLQSLEWNGPLFLRLGKQGEPVLHSPGTSFSIGKGIEMIRGEEAAIISTSNTLEISKKVCENINASGISASLISIHTVKPLDVSLLSELAGRMKYVFTIEEHNKIGGLGSAVSEVIAELNGHHKPLFMRFGVPDVYSHTVGSHNFIRDHYGLNHQEITRQILSLIRP